MNLSEEYKNIIHELPSLEKNIPLKRAVKVINDTMGPEGLVLTTLIRLDIAFLTSLFRITRSERTNECASTSHKTMCTITAELRMRKELLRKAPQNMELVLEPGDKVRVIREKNQKYICPFPVIPVDGKLVLVLQNLSLIHI